MIETRKISDPIQRTASQFGLQHFAATLDPTTEAGPFGGMETAVGDRSPLPSTEPGGFSGDNFGLARTVARFGLCTALFVGTGSFYKDVGRPPSPSVIAPADHGHPSLVTNPAHALAIIRTAFSLQITQIAEILGVSRPTIYAWIGDEQQPQQRCQVRLNQIYSLAEYWNDRSHLPIPASFMIAPDAAGRSLIDMLKSEVIHQREVQSRLDALRSASQEDVDSTSIAALARKYGINLESNTENIGEFDVITRRPMNEA